MERKLDVKKALRVFHKIAEHGQRVEGEYRLGGLIAATDFDGYTVSLRDEHVTLDIFFHNTHKFHYRNALTLEKFMEKLDEVDRREYGKA